MGVAQDIAATYRGPGRVVQRLLAEGPREDRALVFLIAACALMFVAQMPRLARQAHLTGDELNMLMGGALMGWLFIAPLFFYGIAYLTHLVARLFGADTTPWSARIALFWALLAAAPVFLLLGLVSGFVGPGVQVTLVGVLWLGIWLWFWGVGLWQAAQGSPV